MNDDYMRMPSPDVPGSGYVNNHNPSYSRATAVDTGPAGTVFVPELGSYVDSDIAASLGIGSPQGATYTAPVPSSAPAEEPLFTPLVPPREPEVPAEITDEELADLQQQLEESQNSAALSPTAAELAGSLSPDSYAAAIDAVVSGDFADTLGAISEATGLDEASASTLIELAVEEATPVAVGAIGEDAWSSLLYAATSTDDPGARRIVSGLVTGELHPSNSPEPMRSGTTPSRTLDV